MGEPLETCEALLGVVGLGVRFICKGFMGGDEYWEVSIPGRAGRFDGKGGGWRDIVRRCRPALRHHFVKSRRVSYVNKSTRTSPFFLVHSLPRAPYNLYALSGRAPTESVDCRE